jgi:hypothetical protein
MWTRDRIPIAAQKEAAGCRHPAAEFLIVVAPSGRREGGASPGYVEKVSKARLKEMNVARICRRRMPDPIPLDDYS